MCVRKRSFELAFEGIAPELTCLITNSGMAMICTQDRQGEHWDILMDLDVFPARTASSQYLRSQCQPPAHYPSRAALWEGHVFEPLLRVVKPFAVGRRSHQCRAFSGVTVPWCAAKRPTPICATRSVAPRP
jgi:hypothetical protein